MNTSGAVNLALQQTAEKELHLLSNKQMHFEECRKKHTYNVSSDTVY